MSTAAKIGLALLIVALAAAAVLTGMYLGYRVAP